MDRHEETLYRWYLPAVPLDTALHKLQILYMNKTNTFKVAPLGPTSRCLRLINRSLLRTRFLILIISQVVSSSRTRLA